MSDKRKRPGRPAVRGPARRMTIEFDGRLHERATQEAIRRGVSFRALVEAALEREIGGER